MEAKSRRDLRTVAAVLGMSVALFVGGLEVARVMDRDDAAPVANQSELASIQDATEAEQSGSVSGSQAPASSRRSASGSSPNGGILIVGTPGGGSGGDARADNDVIIDDGRPPADPPGDGNPGEGEDDDGENPPPADDNPPPANNDRPPPKGCQGLECFQGDGNDSGSGNDGP